MTAPICYIDGCGKPATLILHTYPDRTLLCGEHRDLAYDPDDPLSSEAEVCPGPSCDVCDFVGPAEPFAWPGEVVPR